MSNDNNDELISQFMAFTGSSDSSKATSYLEMSGGDLETAVGLFMEHEQGGGDSGGTPGIEEGLDVRAPDETQTMRLMDDQHGHMQHDPSFQMMTAMMEEQLAQSTFGGSMLRDVRAAVNAHAAMEDGDDDDANMEEKNDDDEVQVIPSVARLDDLFASPSHLIHKAGGFQGARTMAKDSRRWLLVNIQKDAEFSSHALNRDVWRDELVENLIREGFIFWQQVCGRQFPSV